MLFESGQCDRSSVNFLAGWLPWAEGDPDVAGLYRTKDGGFLRLFSFRGRDPKGQSEAVFNAGYELLNAQLRRYADGWAFWFEAQRRRLPAPACGEFTSPAARLFDLERLAPYAEGRIFETSRYFSVLWRPPSAIEQGVGSMLFGGGPVAEDQDDVDRARFIEETDALAAALRGALGYVHPLSAVEGDTYLHSTISTHRHPVRLGDRRCIDAKLADSDFIGGRHARLDDAHVRILVTDDYPPETDNAILHELGSLGLEYRYVVRWLPASNEAAKRHKTGVLNVALTSTKSMFAHVVERLTGCETRNDDPDATMDADEAHAAMYEPRLSGVRDGDITITVVTWDTDEAAVERAKDEIAAVFRDAGFVMRFETYHAVEAFLGSHPGNPYMNVRRDFMASRNCAHVAPLDAPWPGSETEEPLIWASLGSHPFRLSLRSGRVNHAFVLGETGGGKSVLLGALAMQWQRNPNARVILFDKGRSARIATLCCGGEHIDIGGGAMAFQPLADVDQPKHRVRALQWLKETIADQGAEIGPDLDGSLAWALDMLGALPPPMRTLTKFRALLPPGSAKNALHAFTRDGAFGGLLDADRKPDLSAAFVTLEMAEMMEPEMRPALVPTLTHVFQLIEDMLDGSPTLLVLDECWRFLLDKTFAPRITQWLKELRKRNAGVILATQALVDFTGSPLASAIVQSCKTRIFTPDPRANEAEQARHWEAIAMNADKRGVIASAVPARDYIIDQDGNFGVFSLDLRELGLALIASNDPLDHAEADRILALYGRAGFLHGWLEHKGFGHLVSTLPPLKEGYRYAAQ